MVMTSQNSGKRLAINKAAAQMVASVGIASFVTVFCLVASHTLFVENNYQARVLKAKQKANTQLTANLQQASQLTSSYNAFDSQDPNKIGGSINGTDEKGGDNATLILHALPDSYDFPALTSSLEKIMNDRHLKITSISGVDDQLAQQANLTSANPTAVPMPFSVGFTNASYASVQDLITAMQNSIRPLAIDTITITGSSSSMTVNIGGHTYYEPAKNLTITKQAVK